MTLVQRIFLFLWLVLLGAAHAQAAVFHDSENRIWEISNIGYDAADQIWVIQCERNYANVL
jgi:hypothetical protein